MNNTGHGKRLSNIELLRLISALMIIMCHYATFGDVPHDIGWNFKTIFLALLSPAFGYAGVHVFILISGYFSVGKPINIINIIKIALQTTFYSVLIAVVADLAGIVDLSAKDFVIALAAIARGNYYFPTIYIALMFISPFLNKLLLQLTQKEYQQYLLTLTIIISVVPNIFGTRGLSADFIIFILTYSIAGYIKLYAVNSQTSPWKWLAIGLVFWFAEAISTVINQSISVNPTWWQSALLINTGGRNSMLIIGMSIGIFMCFLTLKLPTMKIVNITSQTALGIYLLHCNGHIIHWLFQTVFKSNQLYTNSLLVVNFFISTITIFFICMLLDLVRIYTLEAPLFHSVQRFGPMLQDVVSRRLRGNAKKTK